MLVRIAVLAFVMLAGTPSRAEINPLSVEAEKEVREGIRMAVGQMLNARNYEFLNRQAEQYRTTRSRTASGIWHLSSFHEGVRWPTPYRPLRTDEAWAAWIAELEEHRRANPGAPWPHIALAGAWHSKAWWHRGTGWAQAVPPESWRLVEQSSRQAQKILLESKAVAAVDPQWYVGMLDGMKLKSRPRDEILGVLYEGVTREPFYFATHIAGGIGLLPKWGGDYETLDRWIQAAAKSTAASEGQSFYARIYWGLWGQDADLRGVMASSPEKWARMKIGMIDTLRRYPSMHNTRQFLWFSCQVNDHEFFRVLWTENNRQMVGPTGLVVREHPMEPDVYCASRPR